MIWKFPVLIRACLPPTQVNDKMQTSKSHIYAVGDVCSKYQFTHVSGTMGAAAMRNALFFGNEKISAMLVPWVTYTEPEVAHVGLYEADLIERGIKFETFKKVVLPGLNQFFILLFYFVILFTK